MPLSDHEKRMLQEMEAALLTEDPRLFSALSGEAKPLRRRGTLLGLGLILLGIATLFGGLVAKITPVGVLGFLFALGGVIALISSLSGKAPRAKGARKGKAFGSRLEQRWDERNNQ
jgi:uncharacterized membrane protein HdeD (DUF308 family)